jgi:hypothetical protein
VEFNLTLGAGRHAGSDAHPETRYKTAAVELGVTGNTVSFSVRRIYEKLQVHSNSVAMAGIFNLFPSVYLHRLSVLWLISQRIVGSLLPFHCLSLLPQRCESFRPQRCEDSLFMLGEDGSVPHA